MSSRREAWEAKARKSATFAADLEAAKDALRRFGTDELRRAIGESDLGSAPEVVEALARIARAEAPAAEPRSEQAIAEALFGGTTPSLAPSAPPVPSPDEAMARVLFPDQE